MVHRGQILEKIVRKSGYKLVKLAEKLDIGRITLYNKFKKENLSYGFIMRVGNVIHYDFSIDFPEMKKQPELMTDNGIYILGKEDMYAQLWRSESKYMRLLGRYTRLLEILIKVAIENGQYPLNEQIRKLIEEGNIHISE